MSSNDWKRVSRRRPCPVCEKPDWCLYVGDDDSPTAAICARVESEKQCGEGGWLHVLRTDGPTWAPWKRTIHIAAKQLQPEASALDFNKLAAEAAAIVTPHLPRVFGEDPLKWVGEDLGVSAESLRRLGVGWFPVRKAWGFPMRNALGEVVGIRLRLFSGKKLSVKGGKEGLFIPAGLSCGGSLFVTEGPTDAASLLDLGFNCIGRPSCRGGAKHIVALANRLGPSEVVIVADADGPGQRGAERLAAKLLAYVPTVQVITPPAKDAREWKRNGATAADVNALIDATPAKSLKIRVSSSNEKASLSPVR